MRIFTYIISSAAFLTAILVFSFFSSGCGNSGTDGDRFDPLDTLIQDIEISSFAITAIESDGIHLQWSCDESLDAVSYKIERANPGGYPTILDSQLIDTSYIDIPPFAGRWLYRIAANTDSLVHTLSEVIRWGPQDSGFIFIPSGTYTLGVEPQMPDEGPTKNIYITGYWIGRCEITNEEYLAFLEAGGYDCQQYWLIEDGSSATIDTGWNWVRIHNGWDKPAYWDNSDFPYNADPYSNLPNSPVVGISWYEAWAYCQWRGYKIPTEAQWTKAATGQQQRDYPWGDVFDVTKCNSINGDAYEYLAPVGNFPEGESPYGCLDMSGNAREMCRDWYKIGTGWIADDTINPCYTDPYNFDDNDKICMGGGYNSSQEQLRVTRRYDRLDPKNRYPYKGFRAALEVSQENAWIQEQ